MHDLASLCLSDLLSLSPCQSFAHSSPVTLASFLFPQHPPPMLLPQCLCTYSRPGINMAEPSSPSGFCSPRHLIYRFLCLFLLWDCEFHEDFALVAALLPDLEWYPEFGRNIYKYIYACMYICVECGGNQLHVSLRECLQCFRCQ